MVQSNLVHKQVADTLKNSSLYPVAKTIYKNVLNRRYIAQRKKMMEFFSAFVKPDDLVFDLGANVGDFTDVFLRLGARVFAVEANPECIHQFKAMYGNRANVTLIDKAIGPTAGKGLMYLGEQGMHNVSTLSKAWKDAALKTPGLRRAGWNQTLEVDMITIESLINSYGIPTFCKIDVEGLEYGVLQCLHQPIPCLSFEYVPWQIEPTFNCVEHLCSLGNYQFNMTVNRAARDTDVGQLELQDWLDRDQTLELVDRKLRNVEFSGDLYARLLPSS